VAELNKPAILVLEEGSLFRGESIGADGQTVGDVVFNTAMTGYQEILTDPSYCGQLVAMTYPQIGNYGITAGDHESAKPRLSGFIVRELCRKPSNYESVESVGDFLRKHGIVAIEGIDTRALTLKLRDKGALRGVISTLTSDPKALVAKAKASPSMSGRNLAQVVSCDKPYSWQEGIQANPQWHAPAECQIPARLHPANSASGNCPCNPRRSKSLTAATPHFLFQFSSKSHPHGYPDSIAQVSFCRTSLC
jgi:carbamoyl-phosphate synthase small subunit